MPKPKISQKEYIRRLNRLKILAPDFVKEPGVYSIDNDHSLYYHSLDGSDDLELVAYSSYECSDEDFSLLLREMTLYNAVDNINEIYNGWSIH